MRTILSILSLVLLCGCLSNQPGIIINKTNFDSLNFKRIEYMSKFHNMQNIRFSKDSFRLRLWTFLELTDMEFVTEYRKSNDSWLVTETRFWEKDDKIDSSKTVTHISKIDISFVKDTLELLKALALPTQANIPDFFDRTADGISFDLEILSNRKYKILHYKNPQYYKDSTHMNFNRLLDFLDRNNMVPVRL